MKFGIVGFDHLKVHCVIGNNPEERETSQNIYIDLRVEQDFSNIAKDDNLEKTICYVLLTDICKKLCMTKKYRLLETLAFDIINILINEYKLKWAFVKIKKPSAIPDADYSIVELEGGRRS